MATSYPSALDVLTNPVATDPMNSGTVPHDLQHANVNDAIEAIEAELGSLPKGSFGSTRARLEASEGGRWTPAQVGLLAMNFDPLTAATQTALTTNGTVYVQKLYTPIAITVTNIIMAIGTAGATLTAGQNFAALYSSAGALLAATADQSTPWASTGTKTMALTTAQAVPAGFFYVAISANATTRPAFIKAGAAFAAINGALAAANARWATANTAITTAMPATLSAFTVAANAYWCGVS